MKAHTLRWAAANEEPREIMTVAAALERALENEDLVVAGSLLAEVFAARDRFIAEVLPNDGVSPKSAGEWKG